MYDYDEGFKKFNTPFLVAGVLLVVLAVGFLFYYFHASSTISTANTAISNLKDQVSSALTQLNSAATQASTLGDQLTAANTQNATLKTQVASGASQVAGLQSQVNSFQADLSATQDKLTAATAQATALQGQLTTANSQVTSLQSQLTSSTSQVSTLQSQVNSLTSQVQTLQSYSGTNSGTSTQLATSLSMSDNAAQQALITSFTAGTSGYLTMTGYSTSYTGYVRTLNTTYGTSANYPFLTSSSTVTIPVQPGTVQIYFGNSDASGVVTANFTSIVYTRY